MFGNAPRALWSKWVEPDGRNRIPLACRALLIEDGGRRILFEAGVGAFFPPQLRDRFGIQEERHVLLDNLEKDAGTPAGEPKEKDGESGEERGGGDGADDEELKAEVDWFYYDEWDFRASDYRPRWCRVGERLGDVGAGEPGETGIEFGDDCTERALVAGAERVDDVGVVCHSRILRGAVTADGVAGLRTCPANRPPPAAVRWGIVVRLDRRSSVRLETCCEPSSCRPAAPR